MYTCKMALTSMRPAGLHMILSTLMSCGNCGSPMQSSIERSALMSFIGRQACGHAFFCHPDHATMFSCKLA